MPYPLLMSVACAALIAAAPLPAQAVPDAQFEPAFQVFMRAAQGEEAAIAQAADAFAALLKAEPANPVLQAYSGAAMAMRARTTMLPWRKMAYAEDGLAQLDKALALLAPAHEAVGQNQVPAVLDVKLVAANTFLALPRMMNRHDRGIKLLTEVRSSPLLASAPAPFREAVDKAVRKAGLEGAK